MVTNLRYADDVVLIVRGIEELQGLVSRDGKASFQFGLSLNASKTKVMKVCRNLTTVEN